MENKRTIGVLLFAGALLALTGIHLAEFLYPGYSVSGNFISDLGATCHATCIVYQPSAFIFNTSVILLGILILSSSFLIWKEFHSLIMTALFCLSGLGAVGVGLFPETAGFLHVIAYPILLWAIGFGGYMMSPQQTA